MAGGRLASARSLRGEAGLPNDLDPPKLPECIRDAKEWLSARMPAAYNELNDQPAFTRRFSFTEAQPFLHLPGFCSSSTLSSPREPCCFLPQRLISFEPPSAASTRGWLEAMQSYSFCSPCAVTARTTAMHPPIIYIVGLRYCGGMPHLRWFLRQNCGLRWVI